MNQYVLELINEGRLEFTGEFEKTVTYHDPCYLGRHNGIYDEPRDLLNKVSGLSLVEMEACGKNSLCCGGGWRRRRQNLDGHAPGRTVFRYSIEAGRSDRGPNSGNFLSILHHQL